MKNEINILVVDDEEIMRNLLDKMLSLEGYNILTAVDGQDALDVVANEKVDLVVTDMKMPRMDGFELLKNLRNNYPDIGVVIMTGFGDTYTLKDALLLGADEYLSKPFKRLELLNVVEKTYWRYLSNKSSQQLV
jgi:CheY-like chemotaxis protein